MTLSIDEVEWAVNQTINRTETIDLGDYSVIVTGAAGFLGRWLVRRLLEYGAQVMSIDLKAPLGEIKDFCKETAKYQHRTGDLDDEAFIAKAFKDIKDQGKKYYTLFHLAGLSHVGTCQAEPLNAYRTNVLHLVKVLDACRYAGINRILFPSTALVYGENRERVLIESDTVNPQNIYASTKLAAEAVIQGYAESYGFSCDIARFSNIYGPEVNRDIAVSIALKQALTGDAILLRNYTPVRDFILCQDAVEGMIRLLISGNEQGCRIFNVSTGVATSIGRMVEMLYEIANAENLIEQPAQPTEKVDSTLVLSNEKLSKRTNWVPEHTLKQGLKIVYDKLKNQL